MNNIDYVKINSAYDTAMSIVNSKYKGKNPTLEELYNNFKNLEQIFNLYDGEVKLLSKKIYENINISLDIEDDILVDKNRPHEEWYLSARANRGTVRYDAYEEYLIKVNHFNQNVVNKIGEATDKIVSNIGDPFRTDSFDYKGLVIGDVQSGKTSNFIALMNKAADAGYNFIIVSTGTIEKLRRQTQERIEIGFGGHRTVNENNNNDILTVKNFYKEGNNPEQQLLTNKEKDYNLKGQVPSEIPKNSVQVAVIKKNKKSLNSLKISLEKFNGKSIDRSLLFIDDEADNASINTREAEDPTVINKSIRDILNLFKRSSYVGFTATPFANVFIDSEVQDDLFPKDFIYVLNAPSNYIGANSIFSEGGEYNSILYSNEDCSDFLPFKHKKEISNSLSTKELPKSLKESICVFMLQNVIRDLRGDANKHRSMLINISHINCVQEEVKELVFNYVENKKRAIKNYILKTDSDIHKEFFTIFEKHFLKEENINNGESWEAIYTKLSMSIDAIITELINSSNKRFQYEDYPNGVRVIAIGGFALSRGLTLEGLSTSYIYRSSAMYDTCMQMGRWFGYRENYGDIIRLYLSEQSIEWYKEINGATLHLKNQIKEMINEKKKPSDFGLMIKESSEKGDEVNLIITSRNKMKNSFNHTVQVSISGTLKSTPKININTLDDNTNLMDDFINKIIFKEGINYEKDIIKEVSKEEIEILLKNFNYGTLNRLNKEVINDVLKEFDNYTVFIPQGKSAANKIDENDKIIPLKRAFAFNEKEGIINFNAGGGNLTRTNTIEQYNLSGLSEKDKEKLKNYYEKHPFIYIKENKYFDFNPDEVDVERNPLIIIYPIILSKPGEDTERFKNMDELTKKNTLDAFSKYENRIIYALSIGVPKIKGKNDIFYSAKMNAIFKAQLSDSTLNDYEDQSELDIDNSR